jgi:LysR family transcriptional regulator for bpeEF and oprC
MRDPKYLMIFAKVAECGSITAAARLLGIPKGSVSRAIAKIEKDLSARLVERSARRIRLTDSGNVLYQHCLRIAAEIESAEAAIGTLQGTVRGKLRVAAPSVFGRSLLSPLIPRFLLKYPDVHIELELTNRQVDPAEENVDFVIRVGALEDSALVVRGLGDVPFGLFAADSYMKDRPLPSHPRDLEEHCLIGSLSTSERNTWTFTRGAERAQVDIKARLDVNDPVIRMDSALAGIGIAHLPFWVIKLHGRAGSLQKILPAWQPVTTTRVYVLYPDRRSLTPKSRAFLGFLEEHIPPLLR